MNKRRGIFAFFLTLASYGFWNYFVPAQKLKQELVLKNQLESSPQSILPLFYTPKNILLKPAGLELIGQGNTSPYAIKPSNNVIEFRVVNGLAIAYGDILLGKVEEAAQSKRGSYPVTTPQLWDKAEVPYLIHPDLPNSSRVEKAISYFNEHTPVRFVPYENQRDAIVFEPGPENCYSLLGRVGGMQPIKLAEGCHSQEIMHEIMHAIGFIHEQSRPDRDHFIEILWQNIEEKYQPQFAMVPDLLLEAERNSPFNYHSIMLYEPNNFTIRPDLMAIRSVGAEQVSPVLEGLSEGDLTRINQVYGLYER